LLKQKLTLAPEELRSIVRTALERFRQMVQYPVRTFVWSSEKHWHTSSTLLKFMPLIIRSHEQIPRIVWNQPYLKMIFFFCCI